MCDRRGKAHSRIVEQITNCRLPRGLRRPSTAGKLVTNVYVLLLLLLLNVLRGL